MTTTTIPKDPADVDGTLDAVLMDVKFRNDNHLKLTDYSIAATVITLTYERTG